MLLEARSLRRVVGGRVVLADISFTLHHQEVLFIRGPNGVGKTLLLRALACLDPVQVSNLTTLTQGFGCSAHYEPHSQPHCINTLALISSAPTGLYIVDVPNCEWSGLWWFTVHWGNLPSSRPAARSGACSD